MDKVYLIVDLVEGLVTKTSDQLIVRAVIASENAELLLIDATDQMEYCFEYNDWIPIEEDSEF